MLTMKVSRHTGIDRPIANQWGISLIELMVGIAISLALLAGTTTALMRVLTAGNSVLQSTRLNHHLRTTLDRISKDLQRAGYVNVDQGLSDQMDEGTEGGDTQAASFATVNPALARFAQIALYTMPSQSPCKTDCSCILFSYDLNEDGKQGVATVMGEGQNTANRELFGYRLLNNEVQMRWAGGGGENSCADGQWLAVSERDLVEITQLNFSWSESAPAICPSEENGTSEICAGWRHVTIELAGRLAADPQVSMTLITSVSLNNLYPTVWP